MQLAANLSLLFTELPLFERLAAAKQAGFNVVEIQFPYEIPAKKLRDELNRLQLTLALINLPAGDLMQGGNGLAANPKAYRAFNEALDSALAYAAVVRPKLVNVLAGKIVQGSSKEHALNVLSANLLNAAQAFMRLQIGVVTEAINPYSIENYCLNTPDDLLLLLDDIAHPNCKAQLDIYHMAMQQINPVMAIERLTGMIGHVQFADYPNRHQPGTGTVDFAAVLAALNSSGYAGFVSAEYIPSASSAESFAWLAKWQTQFKAFLTL